jgi:hypothetical protein
VRCGAVRAGYSGVRQSRDGRREGKRFKKKDGESDTNMMGYGMKEKMKVKVLAWTKHHWQR